MITVSGSAIKRVKPLDLSEVREGDNNRRKAQLKRHYGASYICIVAGCCSVSMHKSVLCIAHNKGLGLTHGS